MKLEELTTIDQLEGFLSGTQAGAFSVISDMDACYRWIQGELVKFRYLRLSRHGKGVVIRYLIKISGYFRQQLSRLIAQYRKAGRLRRRQRTVAGFKPRYTEQDIRLLAEMDQRHKVRAPAREGPLGDGAPRGPAVKRLCERACEVFGQAEYTWPRSL